MTWFLDGKRKRFDPLSKTMPTKLYNWATRIMSGIKLHDFNCGLKAYSINVIKDIKLSGEMHRYIPLLAKHQGYSKIGEKIVNHRKRSLVLRNMVDGIGFQMVY